MNKRMKKKKCSFVVVPRKQRASCDVCVCRHVVHSYETRARASFGRQWRVRLCECGGLSLPSTPPSSFVHLAFARRPLYRIKCRAVCRCLRISFSRTFHFFPSFSEHCNRFVLLSSHDKRHSTARPRTWVILKRIYFQG